MQCRYPKYRVPSVRLADCEILGDRDTNDIHIDIILFIPIMFHNLKDNFKNIVYKESMN